MKKRILLTGALITFSAILLVIITNLIIVSQFNLKSHREDLQQYLDAAAFLYDGGNEETVNDVIHELNPNLRLTLISFEGNVIFDSSNESEFDSHLDRPEIMNLGNIYIRYSSTLKQDMMYLATRDNGFYLRLALPIASIQNISNTFIVYGIVLFFVLGLITFVLMEVLIRRVMRPLHQVVQKMSQMTHETPLPYGDDIDALSIQIDEINQELLQKMNNIREEKEKLNYILNQMNQGIMVVDFEGRIILINQYALDYFEITAEQATGKHYLYAIRHLDIQNKLQLSLEKNQSFGFDHQEHGKISFFSITPLINQWVSADAIHPGAVLMILDVTERRHLETMKRDFFANASHELKSPLTTIIGYQQMIVEGIIKEPAEVEDAVKRTLKEATRMNRIVADMLELSILEAKPNEVKTMIDVSDIVKELLDHFKLAIETKHLSIQTNFNPFPLLIHRHHLVQLIQNLLDNAIKYNTEEGFIAISTTANAISIQDGGIGIPKEDQSRIFERFYRVNKGRSKESGGTGLGLAIVKHICSLYKATITLKSELNHGTTITVQFPKP
jgi:two-component system phosphate regulon sensor histidine kinase PhoR